MSYKEALVSCCNQENDELKAKHRQQSLSPVMTPLEAQRVDQAAMKLIVDIAALVGQAIDDLETPLQINAALFFMRMVTVNAESMEAYFNEEAMLVALMYGARIVQEATPGCDCLSCQARRAQDAESRGSVH